MRNTITVLDQNTIDKIAAGEVVERPASVVKELVENAIDAGASAVTVEIKGGGITFIRITDNGSGIGKDQVPLAFLRHATSKIRQVEDLQSISSLGFRGEALSSIAAVSQVELITKTHEELMGVRYIIEGGAEKSLEEVGAPDGTTFLVRNLFYNTPARAKFLKTPVTEAGYISNYIEQLALSHPYISFKYIQDNRTRLHTSGNDNLKEVIYQVYGRDVTKELLEIHCQSPEGDLEITGFIGRPTVSRGNRNFENYYVNGRYVKSRILMKAIEDAYHTFMMQHKYPFTALCLQVKGDQVDINVHPTKMEVRFSRQEYVYRQVYQAIVDTLRRPELIPEVTLGKQERKAENTRPPAKERAPEPFEAKRRQMEQQERQSREATGPGRAETGQRNGVRMARETGIYRVPGEEARAADGEKQGSAVREKGANTVDESQKTAVRENRINDAGEKRISGADAGTLPDGRRGFPESGRPQGQESDSDRTKAAEAPVKAEPPAVTESRGAKSSPDVGETGEQMELFDGRLLSVRARSRHRIIGQVFDTFWLVQMDDKLYIIDQHAAHEKVLYERIVAQIREQRVTSQMMSPPLIISLNLQEEEILKRYRDVFASLGFEIEAFGGREYSIRAVPQNLYGLTSREMFTEILDHLDENPSDKTLEVLSDRLATMACKAAVKGNTALSAAEAQALIDELLELENPYNCPHGRPTIISMSRYELEKKFKRIV